jgi:hypothetical protein
MTLTQLKPREEAFTKILLDVKKLDAIVICEGRSDVEVFKSILQKLSTVVERGFSIGFTDAEGLSNIPDMATAIAALSKLSRRLKTLVVAIDADEYTIEERAIGLINGLRARGTVVEDVEKSGYHNQVYVADVLSNERRLKVLILVNGDFTIPSRKHVLEDHCVKLLGIPVKGDIDSTKEIIGEIEVCVERIKALPRDVVCEYFGHVCRALEMMLQYP